MVRPVFRRDTQSVRAPHFWHHSATMAHCAPSMARGGCSVSMERGRTTRVSVFIFLVGVPREHTRQNELNFHGTTPGTRYASETARTFCHAQRQWIRSIARMRSMATSDPDPLHLHVCSSNVYKDEPGTTAGGVTSHRSVASFGRILPSLKGR